MIKVVRTVRTGTITISKFEQNYKYKNSKNKGYWGMVLTVHTSFALYLPKTLYSPPVKAPVAVKGIILGRGAPHGWGSH